MRKRAVGGVDDVGAVDRVDRRDDLRAVLVAGGVDRDVAQRVAAVEATRSTEPIVPPTSPIALATFPSMPGRWSISTRIVRSTGRRSLPARRRMLGD
jgi:hypothetical protein